MTVLSFYRGLFKRMKSAPQPAPMTVSEMGRLGRASQLRSEKAKTDALHQRLRDELGRAS